MMRYVLAMLLAMLAAAVAAAPRDWTIVAAPAAAGGYVIGNPKAKVKLVEYISYTCPHCRHFEEESTPALKGKMVRSGSTSVEIRNQIHDKLDLVAVTLGRCIGPAGFPKYHEAVFARQEAWMARGIEYDRSGAAKDGATPEARARKLADASGLSDLARGAGMTAAGLDRCFADRATIDRSVQASAALRQDVRGTPAFEINGTLVQSVGWAQLEPMLRAAGAK